MDCVNPFIPTVSNNDNVQPQEVVQESPSLSSTPIETIKVSDNSNQGGDNIKEVDVSPIQVSQRTACSG